MYNQFDKQEYDSDGGGEVDLPEFEAMTRSLIYGAPPFRRVQGAGCRVQGAGCRVQGAGCRVQD